jgi:ABC-type glycerol-3-phosphate transport system permease component
MAAGGLAATGFVIFLLCWNEYLLAAALATDHAMTMPTWMAGQLSMKEAQAGSEAEEWSNLSAATIVMTAPPLLFAGLAQRLLAQATLWRSRPT